MECDDVKTDCNFFLIGLTMDLFNCFLAIDSHVCNNLVTQIRWYL